MIIKTINELHEFLDTNPDSILNCDDITKLLRNSIKEIEKENQDIIPRLELERATFSFVLEKDVLNPTATFPNEEGVMVSYPSIHFYDDAKFDEIEQIFERTNNHIVAGHLGHFLWINGRRHKKFLTKSKDGYTNIIKYLISLNELDIEDKQRKQNYHQINWYLRKLLFVSQKLKSPEDFKEIILKLLNDDIHSFMHYSLISTISNNLKLFDKDVLQSLSKLCIKRADEEESHFTKIDYYKLGRRVDEINQSKTQPWKKYIADQYRILAYERKDLAAIDFANKASRLYEEVDEKESASEMAKLYEEKSSNKQLSSVHSKVDITDAVKYFDKVIEGLIDADLVSILNYLRQSEQVIPPKSFVDEIVEDSIDYNRMRFFMGNQIFDSNGHVAQHFTSEEEVLRMLTLQNYYQLIMMRFDILVSRLLIRLLDRKDWNAEEFLNTLSKISWLGQPIKKHLSSDQDIDIKYVEYLSPGIKNYFDELNRWNKDRDNYVPDFTLAIDSLTLKVEGLLREICKQIGIQTFYIRKDEKDRNVTKEKDINMLIREDSLIDFIGEDLTIYLKSIFVERVGNNLRNKVAHAFLLPFEYKNFITINKVIIAILRLSVWELTSKEE